MNPQVENILCKLSNLLHLILDKREGGSVWISNSQEINMVQHIIMKIGNIQLSYNLEPVHCHVMHLFLLKNQSVFDSL